MAYFHLLYFIADWTYRLRTLPLSFLEIFAGFEEYCQRPGLRRHNCWWRGCFGRGLCCSLRGCGCLRRGDCGFSRREGYGCSRRGSGDCSRRGCGCGCSWRGCCCMRQDCSLQSCGCLWRACGCCS